MEQAEAGVPISPQLVVLLAAAVELLDSFDQSMSDKGEQLMM